MLDAIANIPSDSYLLLKGAIMTMLFWASTRCMPICFCINMIADVTIERIDASDGSSPAQPSNSKDTRENQFDAVRWEEQAHEIVANSK